MIHDTLAESLWRFIDELYGDARLDWLYVRHLLHIELRLARYIGRPATFPANVQVRLSRQRAVGGAGLFPEAYLLVSGKCISLCSSSSSRHPPYWQVYEGRARLIIACRSWALELLRRGWGGD